jgi:hypothetical protein
MTIRSVPTIEESSNYLPSATTRRMAETVALLKAYALALSEGCAAHQAYTALIARGVDPSEAARRVFDKSFGRS